MKISFSNIKISFFVQVWRNPSGRAELALQGEVSIADWRAKGMNDRWREYTRLAWEISPVLAIFLPVRLKNHEVIIKEICGLVRLKPVPVMHLSEALQYLVTTDTLLNDVPEVRFLTLLFVNNYKLFNFY